MATPEALALRVSIVVADYNKEITSVLLASAKKVLESENAVLEDVIHVPGCFEIPLTAKLLTQKTNPPDAIVALGIVLRGETDQNTHLARSCALSLQQLQLDSMIPIGFGIISAQTLQQAWERAKGELDRGREAAEAAIHMARLKKGLGYEGMRV